MGGVYLNVVLSSSRTNSLSLTCLSLYHPFPFLSVVQVYADAKAAKEPGGSGGEEMEEDEEKGEVAQKSRMWMISL
jgi:hypothetical protein